MNLAQLGIPHLSILVLAKKLNWQSFLLNCVNRDATESAFHFLEQRHGPYRSASRKPRPPREVHLSAKLQWSQAVVGSPQSRSRNIQHVVALSLKSHPEAS
jgi:hypothetical protein